MHDQTEWNECFSSSRPEAEGIRSAIVGLYSEPKLEPILSPSSGSVDLAPIMGTSPLSLEGQGDLVAPFFPSAAALPGTVVPPSSFEALSDQVNRLVDALTPISSSGMSPGRPQTQLREAADAAGELHQGLERVERAGWPGLDRTAVRGIAERVGKLRHDLEAAAPSAGVVQGRQYPMRGPDGKVVARVTPKPVPATLMVASEPHGEVEVVRGLARWFPPHTVHAKNCGTVVDGNDCTLTSKGHYHLKTVEVSFKPFLDPDAPEHAALMGLAEDPTSKGVSKFQKAMREITGTPEERNTQASLPVKEHRLTLATGSEVVHKGDGSRVNVTTHYVIERTELPVRELLAADKSLTAEFAAAVCAPEGGPARDAFTRSALQSAGRVDDLQLLEHSTDLHGVHASVSGFFGVAAVRQADVVLVGSRNTLKTGIRVDHSRPALDGGLADLGRIRELTAPVLAARTAATASPSALGRHTPADGAHPLARLLAELDMVAEPAAPPAECCELNIGTDSL